MPDRSRGVPRRPDSPGHLSQIPPTLLANALLICVLVAGCTDQTAGGPQFANEPVPPRATARVVRTGSPVPLPTVPPAATPVATPASMADLLRARGAPGALFLEIGDAVWRITNEGEGTRVFAAPEGADIRALDASPAADRVAILLRESDLRGVAFAVVVVDGDGQVLERFDDLPAGAATPGTTGGPSVELIDWSPQGNRLLASYGGDQTIVLSLDQGAEMESVALAENGATVADAEWSPTGEAIAYIASGRDDNDRALWVFETANERKTEFVGARENRFVVEFSWLPYGSALLFTEGGTLGGAVSGIDLWRVDAAGTERQLVASAGSVAPVARITDIRPSPDGRSVAYAVLVPSEGRPRVNSVWVRDLTARVGFKVALPTVASVDEIVWTDGGLAIAVTTAGTGRNRAPASAVLLVSGDGNVSALWAAPVSIPGTPAGGPAATPVLG